MFVLLESHVVYCCVSKLIKILLCIDYLPAFSTRSVNVIDRNEF